MPDNTETLVSLARENFGQLTEAEEALFRAATTGCIADYRVGSEEADNLNNVGKWGNERTIRADRIRWLCAISKRDNLVGSAGVRVTGAKFIDELTLDYISVELPLSFSHCVFVGPISLKQAKLHMLALDGARIATMDADRVQVEGSVYLRNGFQAGSMISLYEAKIGGDLNCDRGILVNKGGIALFGDGLEVKGSIFLRGTKAEGKISLRRVLMGGDLLCSNGQFLNEGGDALSAVGARVTGDAFLDGDFVANGRVNLFGATIEGNLTCSKGKMLNATGNALEAAGIKVTGDVFLDKAFKAEGMVMLDGATIGGSLNCITGKFVKKDGYALLARRVEVKASIRFNSSNVQGGVDLYGAKIGGNLRCDGGTFLNTTGEALRAVGAKVTGHIFLADNFAATGSVNLYGAIVGGNLECGGGQFLDKERGAIVAEAIKVKGNVNLDNSKAKGEVNVSRAIVGSSITCRETQLSNAGGNSFVGRGLKVKGDIVFRDSQFDGTVNLSGAIIDGDLQCEKTSFLSEGEQALDTSGTRVGGDLVCEDGQFLPSQRIALSTEGTNVNRSVLFCDGCKVEGMINCAYMKVGSTFRMCDVTDTKSLTSLDLRFAKVTTLEHSTDSWPQQGSLFLNGLTYNALGEKFAAKQSVDWLRLQPTKVFSLQPYEQLAKALKTNGDERRATEVLIAKQDDLGEHGGLTKWGKCWNRVLGVTIKHGYKPHHALLGMLFFVLLGTGLFQVGYWKHLITASQEIKHEKAGSDYPKFQAFVYSLDTFVPIIDLKEKGYWLPNANKGDAVVPGVRFLWGGMLRIYLWIHIIFGWIVTSLWVAGFSGLVRRLT
jgi:hypothetical protein